MEDEKNEKEAMEKKEICGAKFELDKNDEKCEQLDCETGDEMECTYSIDQSNTVTVKEMKFPKLYYGSVNVSNRESTVEVVPLSAYPNEKREKVILWKAGENSKKKIHPRKGDTVKFRLQFADNEWHPKALRIMPHSQLFCLFFF
ncbi:hypothetical protein RFI_35878 [Reticulomyxa filosa]|uniref:Uncharacterized protein n=1 Tax=Reticulomyxa filosa TaxID=46433 RepID=X6LK96_RETFI|nr:hypothetical protein RFI_35878 [Reticulomyxa filosa]|eukprot:ETO01562.1 hypothetical protein RFI_35878 [Reticulomyxa filosa]